MNIPDPVDPPFLLEFESDRVDVSYRYVRYGLGARYQVSDGFALLGGAGFLDVSRAGDGVGEIQNEAYFSRSTVSALDAYGGVGFELWDLEARLLADVRQYSFALNTRFFPGDEDNQDPRFASGASDIYFGLTFAMAIRQ